MTLKVDYQTSDLYFAAYLISLGQVVKGVSGEDRRKVFLFDITPVIDKAKSDWMDGRAMVDASKYSRCVATCKRMLYL